MTNPGDPNFPDPIDSPDGGNTSPQDPTQINTSPVDSGAAPNPGAVPNPGMPTPQTPMPASGTVVGADKKIAAGICGILLGSLGIHKFILGYQNEGLIMLGVSIAGIVLSCFVLPAFGTLAMSVIGLAEGIIYLTKTDQEFVDTYITGRKPWF
ncbi:MAG: TM2 domain-containing protein [Cyanobacteria bacterium J06627_28]